MMACCNLCYQKYIDKNGNVNEDALEEALNRCFNRPHDGVEVKKIAKNVCQCECHVEGQQVLH